MELLSVQQQAYEERQQA
jgi:hypothetical protein